MISPFIKELDIEIRQEENSEDPRWINPTVEQNMQMLKDNDAQNQIQHQEQPQEEPDDKLKQVQQALQIVDELKARGKNRTIQDEAKFKSATQIIAKNPDIVKKLGAKTY